MTFNDAEAVLFQTTLPQTPSGKIELQSSYLGRLRTAPGHVSAPDLVISVESDYASSDQRTTLTFGSLRYSDEVWLECIRRTLRPALTAGMMVRIWNDLGEVHLPLRLRRRSARVSCAPIRAPGCAPATMARPFRRWPLTLCRSVRRRLL